MRVLSVDGGGTRGIIPSKPLLFMQERLGPDLPLHELFDLLAVGTSSGGLIVLTMVIFESVCKFV
jgi:patatin-like phospholipase/acyl hydrolase